MTTNLKPIEGVAAIVGTQLIYTAPANNTVVINLIIYNTHASTTAIYSVHRVPSGGTVSTSNRVISNQTIIAGERHVCDDRICMNLNDTIQIVSNQAVITICGSVAEIS